MTNAKTRILFVEDEPALLMMLQIAVEVMSSQWQARFVSSGDQALALMGSETFDLVVSDMRMPGMSGAQLLNEVMKRYPATKRLILSGYADQDDVWRCVGAAHQFVAKPCELKTLAAILTRIAALRERLPSEEIQKLLSRKAALPTIPAVYFRLVEAVQDPNTSMEEIAGLVATDPGLTAKVLQLVNSAFFGMAREISAVEEAVMYLGLDTLRSLALTRNLFSSTGLVSSEHWSVERTWRHSMCVGHWARRIVVWEGGDATQAEQAFTAGLLHDVGQLLLAENLGGGYLELVGRSAREARPLLELESQELGANHAQVGAYLFDLWGLPSPLVEAVALHHEPSKATEPVFSPLTAVHVANVFEHASRAAATGAAAPQLDAAYLNQLGLANQVKLWREKLGSEETT